MSATNMVLESVRLTTADLRTLLKARHDSRFWMFVEECRNANGFEAWRSADALALGYYTSRGQDLIGYEIKVSRSDWLTELKNPDKAQDIAKFCDYWNLVVSDLSIVKDGELPTNWGLLAPTKSGKALRVVTPAQKIASVPPDRTFLAALVKQGVEQSIAQHREAIGAEDFEKEKYQQYQKGVIEGRKDASQDADRFKKAYEDKEKELLDFEEASGIKLGRWGSPSKEIGAALRKFIEADKETLRRLDDEISQASQRVTWTKRDLEKAEALVEGLRELKALAGEKSEDSPTR